MKSSSLLSRPFAALALGATLVLSTPLEAKDPAAAPAKGAVAERILGPWSIDPEQMLKIMKDQFPKNEDDPDGKAAAAAEAMMKEMVKEMAGKMVFEFKKGGAVRVHSADDEEDGRYKILKSNDATGEFTIEVTSPNEEAKIGTGTITGDKLSMKVDGQEIHFHRLSKVEAQSRIDAIAKEAKEGDQDDVEKAQPDDNKAE